MTQKRRLKKMSKYELVIEEDDCAPDGREMFEKEFLELFGKSLSSVISSIKPIDQGDTLIYLYGNFRIIGEINLYRVEAIID